MPTTAKLPAVAGGSARRSATRFLATEFFAQQFLAPRFLVTPLLAVLLEMGCTVGPDFKTPDPPAITSYTHDDKTLVAATPGSKAPTITAGRDLPAEWWMLFGSAELDHLVRQALTASPTLDQARARLVQAQEDRAARNGATQYPAVNGTLGIERQQIDPATLGFPQAVTPGPFSLYSVGVQVSYSFDLFGGTRRELESLAAEIDYQRYELEAARLALIANVTTTAIRQASLRAQIDMTNELLRSQRRTLSILEQRQALGGVSEGEVENQRLLVAQTAAGVPPLSTALAQSEHLLAVYLGLPPAQGPTTEIKLTDLHLPGELPLSLPSQLAQQRPDIRANEALLHKASADVGVATANLYPRLTLSAAATPTQLSLGDVLGNGINIWNIGATLMQPLFRGGELQARKRSAVAAFDQAAAAYRQSVLDGLRNVADVLRAIEGDAQGLAEHDAQVEHAQNAYRIAVGRYDAGGVSQLEVLDAQRQRLQAELARIEVQANRYADAAALFQALGGGWWTQQSESQADPTSASGK